MGRLRVEYRGQTLDVVTPYIVTLYKVTLYIVNGILDSLGTSRVYLSWQSMIL